MNYYEVLMVDKRASGEEIKRAYRRLVRKYHPDNVGEKDRERFELVQEAYAVLGDEEKRREYDRGPDERAAEARHSEGEKKGNGTFNKQENSYGDPGAFFGGAYQNSFEKFFGFGAKGTDVKAKKSGPVNTDKLFEAFFGMK